MRKVVGTICELYQEIVDSKNNDIRYLKELVFLYSCLAAEAHTAYKCRSYGLDNYNKTMESINRCEAAYYGGIDESVYFDRM